MNLNFLVESPAIGIKQVVNITDQAKMKTITSSVPKKKSHNDFTISVS